MISPHIVGIGATPVRREPGARDEELAAAAVVAALADAGIDPARVSALSVPSHHTPGPDVAEIGRRAGVRAPVWPVGEGVGLPGLLASAPRPWAPSDVVVLVKVMNTATAIGQPVIDPATGLVGGDDQFEIPYGLAHGVQRAALVQRRWMHARGVTAEQLGTLCVVQREHALLNPGAVFRKPLTLESYLASRTICDPIRLFDCDLPVHGAFAYVVTADPSLVTGGRAVRVVGTVDGRVDAMPHIRREHAPGIRPDVAALFAELGITPRDLSALMMYDGFSWMAAEWLERLGAVAPEDVGEHISSREAIGIDGLTPLNTHGGHLSEGRMHGVGHVLEAVRQLRGEAGERQVANPSLAAVTTAYPSTGAVTILEATR